MIRLVRISRNFRIGEEEVHALVDVDEEIGEGEHVAIMGPSGSGKSTLLNVIGCLDRPSAGHYLFDGREVSELDDDQLTEIRREHIGFVFQFFHLVPRLSAAENVELPLLFAGVARGARRRRAREALREVGLASRERHRPDQLSGGERQRVALARATVTRPRLLLADEPTGNLDTTSGKQILDLLDGLNDQGLTIVCVTHDPAVAERADRVLVLVDGRVARRVAHQDIRAVWSRWGEESPAPETEPRAALPAPGPASPRQKHEVQP